MEDLNDFYYFTEVADRGGFSAAARQLKIPKSRLSRRIADLEQRLGARLLQRSTRRLHLTPIGEEFLLRCRAMVIEAQAAQELIERGIAEPRGRIRASCPVMLAQRHVAALLPGFLAAHPKVQLDLDVSNRRVDVIAEGFDVALRVRPPPLRDGDLVAKPLGTVRRALVLAPQLLRQRSIVRPEDLTALPSLSLSAPDGRYVWSLQGPEGEQRSIEHRPRLVTDDMNVLLAAAIAGEGVVMLPQLACADELGGGALLAPLPAWSPQHDLVYAAYASRRGNLPAVQAFLDFLGTELSPRLRALNASDLGAKR
jgi:DNA-binding transcriptional LysR family regulator